MKKAIKLFISNTYDPWFNISIEDSIFQDMDPNVSVLYLWRNDSCVIIGKGQNPWYECNLKKMEDEHVKLARRFSGGGAVYQDLGNMNFTFMAGKERFDKKASANLVIQALKELGVNAEISGRNDIIVPFEDGPRKISGSAYRETFDRGFYHGTLLMDVDLSRLSDYLNPDPKKLKIKGIQSVKSRVINATDIVPSFTYEKFCDKLIELFFKQEGLTVEPEYIDESNFPDIENFEEKYKKQSSWEWNFGKTLAFTHELDERFLWGGVQIQLLIKHGHIDDIRIYTDSLNPTILLDLAKPIIGCRYHGESIQKAYEHYLGEKNEESNELIAWLVDSVQN